MNAITPPRLPAEAPKYTTPAPAVKAQSTNPKDALGAAKLPLHLWPASASAMGSIALLNGALKYGRANWRETSVVASVYVAAAKRHLEAWLEGQEIDEDGVPHLASVLACAAILVDASASERLVDDRNYRGEGYFALVEALTPLVPHLFKRHADKTPAHYTIQGRQP